jgi:hypothetical protein
LGLLQPAVPGHGGYRADTLGPLGGVAESHASPVGKAGEINAPRIDLQAFDRVVKNGVQKLYIVGQNAGGDQWR